MEKPNCYITNECAQKLRYYVNATKLEISGIGKTEIRDGNIYITDIKIYKQKCTGSSTDLDELDMAKVQYQMDQAGEDLSQWNLWWHSHASMKVFWSGTDNETVNSHANNGGFLISLVTNHKGEFKTRVDLFPKDMSPFNITTFMKAWDDIPTEIIPVNYNPERAKVLDEQLNAGYKLVDDKIKEIEDGASLAIKTYEDELMASLKEYKDSMNAEKARMVKEIEDSFYFDNQELIEEYNSLSGTLEENEELKKTIEQEVAEKVTTYIYVATPKKQTGLWFDKKNNDYDDIDYTYKRLPTPTKDAPDFLNTQDFNKNLEKISRKYGEDSIDDDGVVLKYNKPKSKKQLKREQKALNRQRTDREFGFDRHIDNVKF